MQIWHRFWTITVQRFQRAGHSANSRWPAFQVAKATFYHTFVFGPDFFSGQWIQIGLIIFSNSHMAPIQQFRLNLWYNAPMWLYNSRKLFLVCKLQRLIFGTQLFIATCIGVRHPLWISTHAFGVIIALQKNNSKLSTSAGLQVRRIVCSDRFHFCFI